MGDKKDKGLQMGVTWTQAEVDELVATMEKLGYFTDLKSEPEPLPKMAIIKAGQIFVLTSGEWSDYRLRGVFRALKDIDPEDREQWPALEEPYSRDMAAKLVQEGFAEELIFTEWQCSTY